MFQLFCYDNLNSEDLIPRIREMLSEELRNPALPKQVIECEKLLALSDGQILKTLERIKQRLREYLEASKQ